MSRDLLKTSPPVQPLLTLAIPTFNRHTYLGELLDSISVGYGAEMTVELLISDNCSTDETPAVVEKFRSRGFRLRYIRNEVDIGADANFLQCFNEASGKYFWLMGDDDVLAPNAVAQILSLLQKGEVTSGSHTPDFDLVYLSAFSFSGKSQGGTMRDRKDPLGRFAEVVTDGSYFLRRVNALVGLISSIIVNKNRLIENNHLPIRSLQKSSLGQLAWVLPLIRREGRILYVWERLVGYRVYNSGGWGPCQVFGVNLQNVASSYFSSEPILMDSLMNGVLHYWFPPVISDVRQGKHPALLSEDCTAPLGPIFHANWRYRLLVFPLAVSPLWLARILGYCINLSNKITQRSQVLSRHFFGRVQYISPD
jgi:abequosyltransferase